MAAKKSDQRYNTEEAKNKLELFRIILTKDDILRASLQNRKAENLKNEELKHLLKCIGASVGGTRRQLLEQQVLNLNL